MTHPPTLTDQGSAACVPRLGRFSLVTPDAQELDVRRIQIRPAVNGLEIYH
ncbi:hypothetical protein [Pseudovibrio sp. Tun.PSC04-5.I4]|uniref:hypothetical protein n=1 Tax=Pseudovibrio sp. Tun.PSC04-5.I4 TaxID=1798213 RepID=UPI001356366B|nr:hypothetical protein [Pseudovibrio sp. Tun.PSC04-5.I4]